MNKQMFKKWFGKSKIIDQNNIPLILYHGTENDFEMFDEIKVSVK